MSATLEAANRVLSRAARRILSEQEGETVPAPTWGDRHRRKGGADQLSQFSDRQSVDVGHRQPQRMAEAA